MKYLLQEGPEEKSFSWAALRKEIRKDMNKNEINFDTIRRAMHTRSWHIRITCKRVWCSDFTAQDRIYFCKIMLERYPDPEY